MKKRSKKITALFIMLAMLVAVMPTIKAEVVEPRMTYIISYAADLSISSSGGGQHYRICAGKG